MRKIRIGKRLIGKNKPCFIIAEAGSNHNGSFKKALKLIDVAVSAGADAVKFQLFKASKLYPKNAGQTEYLKMKEPIYDIIKKMELPEEWIPKLYKYCKKKKIIFMASVFDEESADILDKYVNVFKIASYEMTHLPLLKHVAKKKKPIMMSTGATNLKEIEKSVKTIKKEGNNKIILMQCTAKYPAPLESINLRVMVTLKRFGFPVGLSDHSREPDIAPMAAVALGANVIEKHFTLSNKLPGPDHKFALEPKELKLMVSKIRDVEKTLGTGRKVVLKYEKELFDFARRSLFAIKDIKKGETFGKENIAVLRKGKLKKGLKPEYFDKVLGKKAKRTIKRYKAITKDMIR